MRSGRLRHKGELQQLAGGSPRQSSSGERLDGWALWKTVRADIRPISGRELRAAGQTQSVITTEIEIRYVAGVEPGRIRFVHKGVAYTIHAVIAPDMRQRKLLLQCSTGAVNA